MEVRYSDYNVLIRREDGSRSRFINANSTGPWIPATVETTTDLYSSNIVVWKQTDARDRFAPITAGQVYEYTDEHDRVDRFELSGSTFHVTQTRWRGGYQRTYTYDAFGNLIRIDDNLGRAVLLTWQGGVITNIALPGGNSIQYSYQQQSVNGISIPGTEVLSQVTRYNSNGTVADTVSYQYDRTKTVPLLTGIVDAKGVLFETTAYDQFGRVAVTQRANGADQITIAYGDNVDPNGGGTRTVTNALGQVEVYHVVRNPLGGATIGSVFELASSNRQASANVAAATMQDHVDTNAFLSERIDWNGIDYRYTNDTQGRETQRIEDYGGIARTIGTTWHPTFRLPTEIVAPNRTVDFTYDANGNMTQRKVTDTTPHAGGAVRTWNFTWTATGQLATATGPRTDVSQVTTYTYDANGNLATVTNALNQTTTVTAVDGRGLPLSVSDPNGVVTILAYDGVGRLVSATVQGPTPATTTFTYDLNGLLVAAQAPNGVTLTYGYDAAHRLTGMADSLGDQMVFTLDALGNRVQTQVVSGSAQVLKTSSATFDTLGRLFSAIGAYGQTTSFDFDNNGNLTTTIDPRDAPTTRAFDALNRVKQVTDALNGVTQLIHDGQDNLTSLTDPNLAVTAYTYNGFGEITQAASPDSGTTTFTRDSAGNITSKTDARRIVTNYTYDALDRVKTRTFPKSTGENVAFTYDETTNGNKGVGRLTSLTDAAGSASFFYDSYGNLAAQTRTISGVPYITSFSYDLAGNLTGITYPSGLTVSYERDSLGRIVAVTEQANAGATTVTLASNIQYLPFGPVESVTLGNGLQVSYSYDEDYRLTRILTGSPSAQDLSLSYDPAGNITAISDAVNSERSQTLQYDLLGRVVQGSGFYGNDNYTYDAVGNRLTRTLVTTGTASTTYGYVANSNRLSSAASGTSTRNYSYDADGNLIAVKLGTKTQAAYTFNNSGRMATSSAASYVYDASGARVVEAVTGMATTHFIFGAKGELLAEDSATGQVQRSYVYLNGAPLALVDSIGSVSYVLSDQVGQPQKMLSALAALNWDRVAGVFGDTVAQPVGASTTNPLRFPGQQYDAVTALHYNFFRDYDPSLGRYIESDPIGLKGGLNTYAYAAVNPLRWIDPRGLDETIWINTQGGRPWYDGPTNGNWGGKCWSGGQYSCDGHPMGTARPTDSGDKCYKDHDNCYAACGTDAKCLADCDKQLVTDLKSLSDDSKKWSQPPRAGTEGDSEQYRKGAIQIFSPQDNPPPGP